MSFSWPLMTGNFQDSDFDAIRELLAKPNPRLTQGEQVRLFEEEFSRWQGSKHAVFVNSGSSANLLTMAALRERLGVCRECRGSGRLDYDVICPSCGDSKRKVLVPCITWASDITSVLHVGFEPVFVDIDRRTLGMDQNGICAQLRKLTPAAVFVTHCMGFDAFAGVHPLCLVENESKTRLESVPIIEDCCEGPGAQHVGIGKRGKLGTFGLASNFSFYYAHHMTTIEGGMVCTDDDGFADVVRRLRGHGLAREGDGFDIARCREEHADLDPQFVFTHAGYNCRSTEINAAIGRSQLKRLDEGIEQRRENLKLFLGHLDPAKYQTDFAVEGSSPYALTLVLRENDEQLRGRVVALLRDSGIECRRGIAGGGNQLRQPYLRRRYGTMYAEFPNAEHVHWNGFAVGNYPGLQREMILQLCESLNKL